MKEVHLPVKNVFLLKWMQMKVWRGEDCEKLDSLEGCGGGVKN